MTITLIGIDCATKDNKIGLSRGYFIDGKFSIEEITVGSYDGSVLDTVAKWISLSTTSLLALDAPLGWPTDLGESLIDHKAGRPIHIEANSLFRRLTDRVVRREIGKQSLDVGADRIARTAHSTLSLLGKLSDRIGETISLAWEPPEAPGTYAIEVYPAATLIAYGVEASGYKGKDRVERRLNIVKILEKHIDFTCNFDLMISNADALDSAICVLAAADFLLKDCIEPADMDVAKKEGWIWVKKPRP